MEAIKNDEPEKKSSKLWYNRIPQAESETHPVPNACDE